MDKPRSRIRRDSIGQRFRELATEQKHSPICEASHILRMPCSPNCHGTGPEAPVILHAVWINDLCRRDPATPVFLNYSDGIQRDRTGVHLARKGARQPGVHLGTWPYALVEIDYEVVRDGWAISHPHPRFRIEELKEPFPQEFMDVARELHLMPHSLLDIVRLHADPRVELALTPTAFASPP